MWAYESVIYQIYPLGFLGAPFENTGEEADASGEPLNHRILKMLGWTDHLKRLGVGAVLFNPLFESDTHGYNTRDYKKVDVRLGTNDDFQKVCEALHAAGIKIILDGVFNHMGRGSAQFLDVVKNRENSRYKDWFYINFDGNSAYNDGLWYEGWEGNYDLVKLNLQNGEVREYLLSCVDFWIDIFQIDGLRLDVAYCLDKDFLRILRTHTDSKKEDFFLVGEMIGGDYNQIMGDGLCHSVTNYECYKGLYSAFNSRNMFEIVHSLLRQFGPENWTLYKGRHLLSFVDNHDVSRIATMLDDERNLPLIYAMMFAMPGIPTIYYGSEWGMKGDKKDGDPALRPACDRPEWNALCDVISALCAAVQNTKALSYGDFSSVVLTNTQCVFERSCEEDRVLFACNMDDNEYTANADFRAGRARDLITGETVDFGGGLKIPPHTAFILQPY